MAKHLQDQRIRYIVETALDNERMKRGSNVRTVVTAIGTIAALGIAAYLVL